MGILNITPDSFFDGGMYKDEKTILHQVEKMLSDGATFIDVGAYSSRPGAKHISVDEEINRVVPVVQLLIQHFPEIFISIDTFRSQVARKCIEAGACMINDISGGDLDAEMFTTVANLQVPYIIMHMQGNPQNMQEAPVYKNVVTEVFYELSKKVEKLNTLHVHDVILDVGFGFGKTLEHNYELLKNLDYFQEMELPLLTGISRKSMLYKPLNISPQEALNATTVANTIALQKGTQILRVHDVKEAVEAVKLFRLIENV
ncbi:dihydropteroate synthase [Wenyingzhuangia sp. 2_MG-2023]|uniref:dihydropteroate synthase n=1 Tax=Wenyingzhuangia sp. 2_MG-2023 TaxID=3062639 RepID=UPI0026E3B4C4|nr:dihydropteroate synthase [Wenyingzhuangia sp. 2_MG-2023]MDO6738079.1 dihydropteroate synthase [Wenyingzhuangia sp. 2_MG-2023]MDO6801597.1 dihydropteroate synthase [Wenyingzhuangia sp. 1_MG-2023]